MTSPGHREPRSFSLASKPPVCPSGGACAMGIAGYAPAVAVPGEGFEGPPVLFLWYAVERRHLPAGTNSARQLSFRSGTPEIFNTDQGSQFTSFAFTGRLQAAGIRISMDGRGRCMDNIFIERLWRSLKYEAIYLHEIADGFTARRLIRDWMGFYNAERPHSALGGRTPAEPYRDGMPVEMWARRYAPCLWADEEPLESVVDLKVSCAMLGSLEKRPPEPAGLARAPMAADGGSRPVAAPNVRKDPDRDTASKEPLDSTLDWFWPGLLGRRDNPRTPLSRTIDPVDYAANLRAATTAAALSAQRAG